MSDDNRERASGSERPDETSSEDVLSSVSTHTETSHPDEYLLDEPVTATASGHKRLRSDVVDEMIQAIERTDGPTASLSVPEEAFLTEEFFPFEAISEYNVVEWYWLNKPYAFVAILYDPDSRTNHYHVFEPMLSETETYVRDDLAPLVKDTLAGTQLDTGIWTEFHEAVIDVLQDYHGAVPAGTLHKLAYYLMRQFNGYGMFDPLFRDEHIEDISGGGADVPTFVYHSTYRDLPTNIVPDDREMDGLVRRLAQRAGQAISFANPLVSATLPDNHRAQLTLGSDIGPRGSNITIRLSKSVPLTPIDLLRENTLSVLEMAVLWMAVEHKRSVLFVGPTASGKTTTMNATMLFIDPYAKVVTVERTRELRVPHDNWISGVTRQAKNEGASETGVTMRDLLSAALHQRPEYLLVGEIRTDPEVLRTFLESVFTGHAGSTTFHARDVEDVFHRFQSEPFDLSPSILSSIDLICVQRQVKVGNGHERRCIRLSELSQATGDTVDQSDIFEYDIERDEHVPQSPLDGWVLSGIQRENGWSRAELETELEHRREFLSYLLDADVDSYRDIWASVFAFRRDRDGVLAEIASGSFDPASIQINYYD